ncbi:serine hydrolase [Siphonobacter sp. SORGH_AS_0500]|uniref:serine hydrolase domain-containing protein n=1 Tax=Siphonobacter sp. SORGH_AS_0500 TaxID=1864824 RepID=UPI000CB65B20|nr:serine hydrolase domain-containing protein [Siphonobacter sp. SORGH_AS_0500]PKK38042.1 serine hydrolase [Siphonobacter sp. SORGH_AS_0500]
MKKRYLALLLFGSVLTSKAQTLYQPPVFTDPDRLEKIKSALPAIEKQVEEEFRKNNFPGLTYGIVVDGQLIDSHSFGSTNLAQKTAASSKSLFRIASMTKSITAMAIIKLRDEGKLRLDDPVQQYIPEVKKTPALTVDAPVITIRHLLTHAAGFPEDNPWGDRQLAIADAYFLKMLGKGVSLSNPPGITYEYSNMGFAMLGRIITVVTQTPYQEYITKEILKPLGMTHTVWDFSKVEPELLAHGYRWENEKFVEEKLLPDGAYGAMGGLLTSIEDFSKYVSFHLAAWPARSEAGTGPIRRSSVREMQQPANFAGLSTSLKANGTPYSISSAYAYGLRWTRDSDAITTVGHSGGLPGFGSNWRILPEYGIGVITYANLTYANAGLINTKIIETLLASADLKKRQLPVSKILNQRKKDLVSVLKDWNQASHYPIFAENFFPDKSLALRKKASEELFSKVGKIVKVGDLIPENQLRGTFIMEGEQGKVLVYFTLSPENPALIQQLDLREVK